MSHREEERRDSPRGSLQRGIPQSGARESSTRQRDQRKRPWLLLVAVILLFALVVAGGILLWRSLGDAVSGTSEAGDSLDSGPEPSISLVNGPGRISVEGVEDLEAIEYEVTKHATARDSASAQERASEVEIDVSREGPDFRIETGGSETGADYALRVPPGASVEIESEAGKVAVSGLSGDSSVIARSGDVSIQDAGGSVDVRSPMGDVEISNVSTETGQVNLEVGAGDVDLTDLVIGALEASVESGDASLSGRFSGGGRILVQTGNINVDLPPQDAQNLSLEAQVGNVERESEDSEASEEGSEE